VEDSTSLWEAWKLAKAYHCRPSDLYGIRDEVAALSFDRAIYLFGTELESELRAAQDGAKNQQQANIRQQRVMAQWLGTEIRYKSPGAASPGKPATSGTVTSEGSGPQIL
jgi:hypothetical protein